VSVQANRQLLETVYTELSKGNPKPFVDSLADDIEWTIIGSTPLSGTYRGKRDVLQGLFGRLRARLADGPTFEFERFIAADDHVVMQAQGYATSVTGAPYNNSYCVVARIVEGKLCEMIDYVDTELITRSLFTPTA
jgi:ketosteroid isomerase-like protein